MVTQQAKNRRNGADFELRTLDWLRNVAKLPAERLRLTGAKDEGDLAVQDVGLTYVVECKNVAKANLTDFVRQARAEALNYAEARGLDPETVMPVVVLKRRNAPISESFVITPLAEFFTR